MYSTFTHTHTHIHIDTDTDRQTDIRNTQHTHTHTHTHSHTHKHTHTHTYIHIDTDTDTDRHTQHNTRTRNPPFTHSFNENPDKPWGRGRRESNPTQANTLRQESYLTRAKCIRDGGAVSPLAQHFKHRESLFREGCKKEGDKHSLA